MNLSALRFEDVSTIAKVGSHNCVYSNSRVCRNETVVNGLRIPKDLTVQFPVYFLAHDPDYWEDPWEYKPERYRIVISLGPLIYFHFGIFFRMEDMAQIDSMMFQPFGAGPRNCIGMRFAEMEIKMTMCRILHKYTIKPCEDTPVLMLFLSKFLTVSLIYLALAAIQDTLLV